MEYVPASFLVEARRIGNAYLDRAAPTGATDEIDSAIARALTLIEGAASEEDALSALRAEVIAEFAEGQVSLLDGWVLAPIELQVCALLSLSD